MTFDSFFNQLHELLRNPVFLASVSSWFITQFIKTLVAILRNKIHKVSDVFSLMFWRTGGMPSSHSALVCAVTTAIGFRSGVSSDIFVLSFCLAMIVIRDALGVRRSSGIQAKTLNEVGKNLNHKFNIPYKPVKEIQGHQPAEVLVGAILGFFIGLAFSVL